jgi:uncharacterized membrane protein YcaP (DUF421 family)
MWTDMFALDLPVMEKIVRAVIIYLFLLLGFRLAGKRELAQLNAMDLVVLLLISNTVQNSIIGNDNSITGGVVGATTLLLANYLTVRYLFAHPKFDRLIEGSPTVLMADGHLNRSAMQKELVTRTELQVAAHRQGFGSLGEVEQAVLEPSGVISFTGKDPTPTEAMRDQILKKIDELTTEIEVLKKLLQNR